MPDEALQAAFEIKAACDDISRKLLCHSMYFIMQVCESRNILH